MNVIWRWMGRVGERPDFRRLWLASTGSAIGTYVTLIALSLVAVKTLNATAWQVGALQIASTAPSFLIGLIAGAWIDRLRRRPVMIACDLTRAVTLVLIPVAAWLGWLTMPLLVAGATLLAIASLFFEIADRSMLPTVVGRDELVDANRMITAGATVSEAGGFALGGWLVHLLSGPAALLIDSASFVWSAMLLRSIETPEPPPSRVEEREPILAEIREGLRLVFGVSELRVLAGATLLVSIGGQIVGVVYMIFVSRDVGFDAGVLGMIFATGGIFSLLGSITANRVTAKLGMGRTLAAGLLMKAVTDGSMSLVGGPTILGGAVLVSQQVGDYGATLYQMGEVSVRQTVTDDDWQGRMHGAFRVLEFGGYLIGALIGGYLGGAVGARDTIIVGAVVTALAAAPIMLSRLKM